MNVSLSTCRITKNQIVHYFIIQEIQHQLNFICDYHDKAYRVNLEIAFALNDKGSACKFLNLDPLIDTKLKYFHLLQMISIRSMEK